MVLTGLTGARELMQDTWRVGQAQMRTSSRWGRSWVMIIKERSSGEKEAAGGGAKNSVVPLWLLESGGKS